jgi:two-component system LytT family sensor kinase
MNRTIIAEIKPNQLLKDVITATNNVSDLLYLHNMEKKLFRKLLVMGLISSPIMALYGITPLYVLYKMPLKLTLIICIGLMINVIIFWLINILIIKLVGSKQNQWQWYLASYVCVLTFHFSFIAFRSEFVPEPILLSNLKAGTGILLTYPFISILAMNTIIIIICNSILTTFKKEKAEIEIEQLKFNQLEAQQKVLIQQLQPHFLFNTLSVLKSLIQTNPETAEHYTIKLSEFLRYSLQVNSSTLVTVSEEMKFTNDYIELQKVRFEDSLNCHIEIPASITNYLIPAYAIQTLVENAIKHNAFTEKKPLHIYIQYLNEKITVTNNKYASATVPGSGTGLENLNKRYQLISNKEIIIKDEEDYFSVTIFPIPKKK